MSNADTMNTKTIISKDSEGNVLIRSSALLNALFAGGSKTSASRSPGVPTPSGPGIVRGV